MLLLLGFAPSLANILWILNSIANLKSSFTLLLSTAVTPVEVHHEAPPVNPEDVEAETQKVLQQLEGIECSVSKADPSINAKKQDNRLYGLHALNNLDIAVNGKEVNSMPSYQEIRRNSLSSSNNNISQWYLLRFDHPFICF